LLIEKGRDRSVLEVSCASADHGYAACVCGFHHFGIAFADVDAALPGYLERGHTLAFRAPVPTGGSVAYLNSADPAAPGFLELIPATEGMNTLFTAQWQAAQDWDGQTDPVRPFL
jgi:hypothetical protein